jgi:hypothetical protein
VENGFHMKKVRIKKSELRMFFCRVLRCCYSGCGEYRY